MQQTVRDEVLRLFEQTRQAKGAPYEPERFMAFLTHPPAENGRRVADTFRGRRHFVRFMESAELSFGVCFTNEEWERGFSLDGFVQRVEKKLTNPGQAHRLACTRLLEARYSNERILVNLAVFFLTTIPLFALFVRFHNVVVRIGLGLIWAGINGSLQCLSAKHKKHYKQLVERTCEKSQ